MWRVLEDREVSPNRFIVEHPAYGELTKNGRGCRQVPVYFKTREKAQKRADELNED